MKPVRYFNFEHHADGTLTCQSRTPRGVPAGAIFAGKLSDQQAAYIVSSANDLPKLSAALTRLRACFNDRGGLVLDPASAEFEPVERSIDRRSILAAVDALLKEVS